MSKKKTKISIQEVVDLNARLRAINRLSLEDIIWTLNGKPIPIDKKTIEEWDFTGLSNADFIISGAYKSA